MNTAASTPPLSSPSPAEVLRQALGIPDPALARVLCAFGLDHTCTSLVVWIPAIEIAWLDGRTAAKQRRLLDLIRERHHALGVRAEARLREWLVRRPSDALFRTARRVLRAQLEALPPDERPAWRARVIGPCADLAHVSRGWLGWPAVSDGQHEWLLTLADDLRTPDEQHRTTGGGLR